MSPLNRRQLLQGLAAGGLGLTVLGRYPQPGLAAESPLWTPGVLPDPTKPEGTDLLPQIEHIVVLMMENHSFDNYFGTLGRGDGLALGPDGLPLATNPDGSGGSVRLFNPGTTDQTGFTVRLGWNNVFRQVGGGAMDGFVVNSGLEAMTYFDDEQLPFYRALARQFVLCDRYFCSVPGATYPNRRFLSAGTAAGITSTAIDKLLATPDAPNGTIYERLDAYGISWNNYSAGLPEVALWPGYYFGHEDKIRPMEEFYEACRAGTLPGFSLVTPSLDNDEHPPKDIALGEQFSAGIIREVMDGPGWAKTVLVFTYDEHGGFYDHVPPPHAIPPDGIAPIFDGPVDPGATAYDRYGLRVPAVVVSPYARADYVSSVVHDHTSILRLIETKWNLGSITQRDADASNLLDTLDLTGPPADPPDVPPPAVGYPDITRQLEAPDRPPPPGFADLADRPDPPEVAAPLAPAAPAVQAAPTLSG